MAVAHKIFFEMGDKRILSYSKKNRVIFDIKNVLTDSSVDGRL